MGLLLRRVATWLCKISAAISSRILQSEMRMKFSRFPSLRANLRGRLRIRLGRSFRLAHLTVLVAALLSASASGQEPLSGATAPSSEPAPTHQHTDEMAAAMRLYPTREATGTGWVPDSTPMYGVMRPVAGWQVMVHGQAVGQFLAESGSEHHRSHQTGGTNWIMGMARREVGKGRVSLRAMASVESWTVPGCGYPNLLATGEVCDGDTIHDRQHPHDLFMEIAASYDRQVTPSVRWQIYGGPAGEPALGPVGFPHRLSAAPNPLAPIAHHWLDPTHISFGVVTTGVSGRTWKAELSAFNGREPDDNRSGLELGPLDSISGRLSWLPRATMALQVSAGRLQEAEAGLGQSPRTDVTRATASLSYVRDRAAAGIWATTLAYGVNAAREPLAAGVLDATTHAVLLETNLIVRDRHTWFGRLELVGKPGHDLHVHEAEGTVFTVGKLQGGYVRLLPAWHGLVAGVGGTASASFVPAALAPRYEGRLAPGAGVFVSLRPARMRL
jgi:hypothetical protein